MTLHTRRCRSYLSHSWAILQMRCEKGHLQMRSSVLILYQQISWWATIPSQYFWGLFISPLFKSSLWKAFSPTAGLILLAGSAPTVPKGPTSANICTSCWVSNDLGDLPTSSSLPASSLLLCSLSGEGRALGACASIWAPSCALIWASPSF